LFITTKKEKEREKFIWILIAFRYLLPVLIIYSSYYVYYRFAVLAVYIRTRSLYNFVILSYLYNKNDKVITRAK